MAGQSHQPAPDDAGGEHGTHSLNENGRRRPAAPPPHYNERLPHKVEPYAFLFLADALGREYPPPITHRDIYFGFVMVALAWQVVFLIIGRDPVRYRPLMIAAAIEKFGYVGTLVVLWAGGSLPLAHASVCSPDLVLGVLIVVAFVKTRGESARWGPTGYSTGALAIDVR